MRATRPCIVALLIATTLGAKPIVTVGPDDVMDSRRPKAPLTSWSDGPGRRAVALNVPGATLRGFVYTGGRPGAPLLLMFGGSGNLIVRHDGAARGLARFASQVAFYDYRAYGFSTGTARFADLEDDAVRIYDAVAGRSPRPVVVLGYSMGTAVAEYVATRRPIGGLILCAPWNDFVAADEYVDAKASYVLTPEAKARFDEVAMVRRIRIPLLVLQGTRDDVIPPQQGPALERAAVSRDKRFAPIAGAKHDGLLENPQTQAVIARFLRGSER
jgi:pimeloyl-ACP methyl ester carboxylesterase